MIQLFQNMWFIDLVILLVFETRKGSFLYTQTFTYNYERHVFLLCGHLKRGLHIENYKYIYKIDTRAEISHDYLKLYS